MTDEIDALERGRVEPTAKPARQPGGGKPPSEPRQVEQVDAPMLRQWLQDRSPPAPGTRKPVDEDERFALARDPILGRHSVDHESPKLHNDQFRSRWLRTLPLNALSFQHGEEEKYPRPGRHLATR